MIPAAVIDEIRARIDPVEIIGRRVELKKSGNSFSASCPFHADRTPSFRVFPDSKRFKCFGCGARGDVFEFLRRIEGKGFPDAVRELAAEVGVPVAPDPSVPRGATLESATRWRIQARRRGRVRWLCARGHENRLPG